MSDNVTTLVNAKMKKLEEMGDFIAEVGSGAYEPPGELNKIFLIESKSYGDEAEAIGKEIERLRERALLLSDRAVTTMIMVYESCKDHFERRNDPPADVAPTSDVTDG